MSIGTKESPQPEGRKEKPSSPFPEQTHRKHAPIGEAEDHYVSRSESVGRGHEDFDRRHPHLFRDRFEPNKESKEGQDNIASSEGAGLFPEFE